MTTSVTIDLDHVMFNLYAGTLFLPDRIVELEGNLNDIADTIRMTVKQLNIEPTYNIFMPVKPAQEFLNYLFPNRQIN